MGWGRGSWGWEARQEWEACWIEKEVQGGWTHGGNSMSRGEGTSAAAACCPEAPTPGPQDYSGTHLSKKGTRASTPHAIVDLLARMQSYLCSAWILRTVSLWNSSCVCVHVRVRVRVRACAHP